MTKDRLLTLNEARQIRDLSAAGIYNFPQLAALYGVSRTTVVRIIRRRSYKE